MKIEIIPNQREKIAELNALVSEAFGYQVPHTFLDDFPVWASHLSSVMRLGIYERSDLIAHVGIRYAEMQTDAGLTPVALIGAVATDPHFRKQGLSTELMTEALKLIDEKKSAWTFLWGSEHDFYAKFGFRLQGKQARAPIAQFSIQNGLRISPTIHIGLTETIFQTLLKEKAGIRLTEADRGWIFEHKTIQWLSIASPFAFVAYEKGMDLKHMVHEMGGDERGIKSLLYQIHAHDPNSEVMARPAQLKKLGFEDQAILEEHLCLARPQQAGAAWNESFWVAGISAC